MKAWFRPSQLLLAVLPLLLVSCFKHSTTIKVNPDGSGIVEEKLYMDPKIAGMMAGMAPEGKAPPSPLSSSVESLEKRVEGMGEGITLKSSQKTKNEAGWDGLINIFAFNDIAKLRYDLNESGKQLSGGGNTNADDEPSYISFEREGKTLRIYTPDPAAGASEPAPQLDEATNNQALAMMAPMLQGMHFNLSVEAVEGIAESNAKHRSENAVTIMALDFSQIIKKPANLGKLQSMGGKPNLPKMQKMADEMDGLSIDTQNPIEITLK